LKLEMTRVIKASKQRVFDAWTRPEFVRQWFGPEGKACSLAETDPRVGGAYTLELRGEPCGAVEGGIDMPVFAFCRWKPRDLGAGDSA